MRKFRVIDAVRVLWYIVMVGLRVGVQPLWRPDKLVMRAHLLFLLHHNRTNFIHTILESLHPMVGHFTVDAMPENFG